MISIWLNVVASGLLTGMVYGLAALGLSVIFGVVRIVNFAHGEIMVAGMYVAVLLATTWSLDPLVSAPVVAGVLFVLGWVLQRGLINRFADRPEHQQFLLLAGVAMVLENLLLIIFGPEARGTGVPYLLDSVQLGPFLVDTVRLYAAGGALVVAGALFLFFAHSRYGVAIRACADNRLGAKVIGLNVERLYALTCGLGAATAGVAGALLSLVYDARPQLAPELTLLSFVTVIVGGLGSMGGALLAGVLLGVAEAVAGFVLLPSLKSLFSYALLVLVLLLRPQGLMGGRE